MNRRALSKQKFDLARRQARREEMTAWITGRDASLLPFEEIRKNLSQQSPLYRGAQEISLKKIVGSVGRFNDLTRHFLPRNDQLRERWIGIDLLVDGSGWPPIDLYRIGDVYFVKDGNHRVSVARQMEMDYIEAHVWEYPEEVQISADDEIDDVLIRFHNRILMETTGLAERYPEHGICFTTPGQHVEMFAQIEDLRCKLQHLDDRSLPYEEAADAWYEMVYLPTVQIIRESTLLEDFSGRTEADLFVWMSKHREQLRSACGCEEFENLSDLAQILTDRYKEGGFGRVTRQLRRLLGNEALPPLKTTSLASDSEDE
jgi:hypothetical protein